MFADVAETHVKTHELRIELKQWENAFRAANGRRPERGDIKADAVISEKYKRFNRLAGRKQSGQDAPPQRAATSPRNVESTPQKSSRPSLQSPAKEIQRTPACIRTALGPTPQKDGQVLGIFDFASEGTPVQNANSAGQAFTTVSGTPSKPTSSAPDQTFSKTPQSSGRRFFLDVFAGTPLKRKREESDEAPGSSSRREFATPSFLRRSFPLASIDEEGASGASTAAAAHPKKKKRSLTRSLSSIIQGLKKQEEERMDDEWDVLNELEREAQPQPKQPPRNFERTEPEVPTAEMPLGADQALPDSDTEQQRQQDMTAGLTRKPWKKKGLKRQTRRVIMRPVLHRPRKADDTIDDDDDDDDDDDGRESAEEREGTAAQETRQRAESDSDGEDDEYDNNGQESYIREAAKPKPGNERHGGSSASGGKATPRRKVRPDAHANFRKLKLKNKNSKANRRGKGFGRRR